MAEIPTHQLAVAVGTLAHNRSFSPRDVQEYTGRNGQKTVKWLVEVGLLKRVAVGRYYPTSKGWAWIDSAADNPVRSRRTKGG